MSIYTWLRIKMCLWVRMYKNIYIYIYKLFELKSSRFVNFHRQKELKWNENVFIINTK